MRPGHARVTLCFGLTAACLLAACGDNGGDDTSDGHDPATAPRATIDRFSAAAGHLMVRDGGNDLPAAGAPIDMDQEPFITHGLGPGGSPVRYYNFDVQPVTPAPIYVLFRDGEDTPVADQLNIVPVIPGDPGYNDLWQVVAVTVPADYVANTAASVAELVEAGYPTQAMPVLVNCPVVPAGSTATRRIGGGYTDLTEGWYGGQIIQYFHFAEAELAPINASVPTSPIYVTFNINPDQPGGGPPSGFVTEPGTDQTHNVVASVPGDTGYSPLWAVNIYDNADFDNVSDLTTAEASNIVEPYAAMVNCPLVEM
ncbi:MAG: hypothetical protein H6709_02615 [Kofleriaceae bacterium]|nr:hypothetical protein [Myxococcales bacterium]MCB9565498.1 hypothetical protein [Kofleriaceae bacterium]MCB9570960.1 hypothetical protein [Kofleriaceae bacterium]